MLRIRKTVAPAATVLFVACGRTWLPDSGAPVQETGAPDASEQLDAPDPTEAAVPEAAPPDANEASPPPPPDANEASLPPVVTCPNAPGLQANAPWPTTRRCLGRTASTPVSGPQRTPGIAWSQKATTSWISEPVIAADGTVYAIDWGRGLVALAPGGTVKWAATVYGTQPGGGGMPPTMLAMLTIGVDGSVFAIELGHFERFKPDGTGEYPDGRCSFEGVQPGADGSADVFGRMCDPGLSVGILTVPATGPGVLFWSSDLLASQDGENVSLPSYGPGGPLYFVGESSKLPQATLFALVGDSKQGWSWALSAPTDQALPFDSSLAGPIVRDDDSVVFADKGGLHAVTAGGAPLWNLPSAGTPGALAAGPDGTVYYGSPTGLVAVSPSGTTVTQLGGVTQADRPIVDGEGTVYAGAAGGIVAIASDGTELWQTSVAATPLAIDATGTFYALDASGQMLSALR